MLPVLISWYRLLTEKEQSQNNNHRKKQHLNKGIAKKLQNFGWIEFSEADMKRTGKALAELSNGSLDELGISIIRNGFANKLFPGISVLQTSLKYFMLIPAMLKKIERDNISYWKKLPENHEGIIYAEFRKKLIDLQCDFCDDACKIATDKTNIIGNETANDPDRGNRLLRYPHEIFWPGLYTFGLVESPSMGSFVRNMMVRNREQGDKKTSVKEHWKRLFPFEPEDILKVEMSTPLKLLEKEKAFLFTKIKDAVRDKNTLLEKLIDDPQTFKVESNVLSIAGVLKK